MAVVIEVSSKLLSNVYVQRLRLFINKLLINFYHITNIINQLIKHYANVIECLPKPCQWLTKIPSILPRMDLIQILIRIRNAIGTVIRRRYNVVGMENRLIDYIIPITGLLFRFRDIQPKMFLK